MSYQQLSLSIDNQRLPLKSVFRIARGAKTSADVLVVTLTDGANTGWAESVPYGRYGESIHSVTEQIEQVGNGLDNEEPLEHMLNQLPSGSARNALDCAWWDLKAKQANTSVKQLLKLPKSSAIICAQTLSIDTPDAMAQAVSALGKAPLVKIKLDSTDIIARMKAIKDAAPKSRFIIDANEGWTIDDLADTAGALKKLGVALIEQPLSADNDEALKDFDCPIPLCADESCHTSTDLNTLKGKYQVVNIKLDKTGGLSEAVVLAQQAKQQKFGIMLGCMVGSSLAMAPASLLTAYADFVDLDGPLLIAQDRVHGFQFCDGIMQPLNPKLWGGCY